VQWENPLHEKVTAIFEVYISLINPQLIQEGKTKAKIWAEEKNHHSPLCKCGCGSEIEIKPHHRYVGIPNYIPYHQHRDRKWGVQ